MSELSERTGRLVPAQLSPRALKTYACLNLEESRSYDTIQKLTLSAYKQDAEYYLKNFRSMRRSGPATYKNYLTNLKEMANRYLEAKGIDSLDLSLIHI